MSVPRTFRALDDPTNIANRGKLERELDTTNLAIGNGESTALEKGVVTEDWLRAAKSLTQQRYAMQEVKAKLFNNESVVEGDVAAGADETINTEAAIKAVQKLDKPSKFAPEGSPSRLRQAFGDKGADALKKGLYEANKQGLHALNTRKIARWALGIGAPGVVGIYELWKK
jgi:hypothetical protein